MVAMSVEVDWPRLRATAAASARNAYAPYSRLRVGAAALTADGRVLSACNVENASYGLTLCAECGLVSVLHATGGGRLAAVSVTAADGELLMPCGRCRQLLLEAGGGELMVDCDQGPQRLADLLPAGFSPDDVARHRDA
jgi:cytidine deaminase